MDQEELDQSEQLKTVYAHFGVAIYLAQVLEHGIVNALVVSQHIPNALGGYSSQAEWESAVDAFMDGHFTKPLGALIKSLKAAIEVQPDIDALLTDALKQRNWLAHHFFRARATEFLSSSGRVHMIDELVAAQQLLISADKALEQVVRATRIKYGITDEVIEAAHAELLASIPK